MTSHRVSLLLYFLTLFFVGFGYLAILPAFEGFDENAHYSSIRQIADIGTIPIYGASLTRKLPIIKARFLIIQEYHRLIKA